MRQKIPVAVICILCLIKAIMLVFPRASVQRVRDVYSGRYVLQAEMWIGPEAELYFRNNFPTSSYSVSQSSLQK